MSQKQDFINMGTEIKALVNLMTKLTKQSIDKRLKDASVNIGILSFSVLRILSCENQMISELGDKLILKSATLVPVIDSLEKKGLVKKTQDQKDRRCFTIAITPKGIEILKKVSLASHDELMIDMMEKIGKEDSERFLLILRKVIVALGGEHEIKNISNTTKLINSKI